MKPDVDPFNNAHALRRDWMSLKRRGLATIAARQRYLDDIEQCESAPMSPFSDRRQRPRKRIRESDQ